MRCGAREVLKFNYSRTYRLKMNGGRGTDTHAKLRPIWCLLYFVRTKQFFQLQVIGKSKVIIDLLSKKCNLQVSSLEGWQRKIRNFKLNFHK